MVQVIIETLWFFLPAMVANMAPVIAAKYKWLPGLDKPLDGGLELKGERLLGSHKTIRGFVVGIIVGSMAAILQAFIYRIDLGYDLALVSYDNILFAAMLGALLGFGALAGDAVKSFIKRRLRIESGKSFPVFDQIDFVAGAVVVTQPIVTFSFAHVLSAFIIIGVGSFVVSVIGVTFGIKKEV